MKIVDTPIEGLKILEPRVFEDTRGKFVKTFNQDFFKQNGLDLEFKETYFSISHKDVIRGMHFQTPPYDHVKVVYVPYGKILDVVLDIRKESKTYGEYFSTELSCENAKVLIIPKGLAHGFKSLEDNTNVTYMQTTGYAPNNDEGILYDSFGFDWECENPQCSQRDLAFKSFGEFETPFSKGQM
ncbi:dTDP-4-dehydrorhamnose 3,5-epimerase [Candidatus Marinarcus aquaticus]|uniref:dTDP-4-dehydrorhamnose 3,5-epimerase n=1 Tax=Candidatus Marinarcus aquaticus TaxID=2044504 RepID=A0A4V1LNR2_9BACT|nr:dTDP-4-dehydrorhamnose 3,5-epimerase [Candidatus Marinarcus aquaticus]RXJ55307.1 dTDP-4-dehydrorhamnose 3,5-epimerase [Candidatus Marinarcus aquaticus]